MSGTLAVPTDATVNCSPQLPLCARRRDGALSLSVAAWRGATHSNDDPVVRTDTERAKALLRARIREQRGRRLADSGAAGAKEIASGLLRAFRAGALDGGSVAAYLAMPGEPDPAPVCAAVRDAGQQVLLPVPLPGRELAWALDDGRRGIAAAPVRVPVPLGEQVGVGAAALRAHDVRVLLIPALAVDTAGRRLGQGGGYYDRLLEELAHEDVRVVGVLVVAVVHDDEVLDAGAIPVEPHDRSVHAALTPSGLRILGAAATG